MSGQWISSAALVALVVAIIVFPWQRGLEHKYLIKKEKRELYRLLLAKFSKVREALLEHEYESAARFLAEFEGLSYEADLLTSMEVSNALRDVSGHCEKQIKPLPQLYEDLCYQQKKEPEKADATSEKLAEAAFKIGYANGFLTTLLKEDIEQTASVFDWNRKKRVAILLEAVDQKFGD